MVSPASAAAWWSSGLMGGRSTSGTAGLPTLVSEEGTYRNDAKFCFSIFISVQSSNLLYFFHAYLLVISPEGNMQNGMHDMTHDVTEFVSLKIFCLAVSRKKVKKTKGVKKY